MARSSLLKLISACFLLVIAASFSSSFIVDDFEVVTEWSVVDDCIGITLNATNKLFGTYSGKVTCVDEITGGFGSGEISKSISPDVNYIRENISIWILMDTSAWGVSVIRITLLNGSNPCIDSENMALVDDTWTHFNENVTNLGTYSEGDCAGVDSIKLGVSTDGAAFGTEYFYLDVDPCEFDLVIGDAIIENDAICVLNQTSDITGNLNISDGSLEVAQSGALTISGGFGYISPGSNLTILSGGQING